MNLCRRASFLIVVVWILRTAAAAKVAWWKQVWQPHHHYQRGALSSTSLVDVPSSSSSSLQVDDNDDDEQYRSSHPKHMRDIPEVPFLVETLGKEMYGAINKPKYKFYFYMSTGLEMPDETAFCIMLNMLCNLLYGILTLVGFCVLPRHFMLAVTALTLWNIGPVLVLLLLGTAGLLCLAFCLYPTTSVAVLWIAFFLPSRVAQLLGRAAGLDQDDDGDVDWLDVWHWVATQTWLGRRWPCLGRGHAVLNAWWSDSPNVAEWQQATDKRLDLIQQQQVQILQALALLQQQEEDRTSTTLSSDEDDDDQITTKMRKKH